MATPAGERNTFCFGLFEADPSLGQLLRQGERVRLQDQPFRMLMLLLERAGEVITREELREKLWPENTFVEFDNGLNVAVKKIRDALSDNAENPRFVETVPRRGYRFIAPVAARISAAAKPADLVISDAVHVAPVSRREPGVPRTSSTRRRYLTAAVAAVAAGLIIAGAAVVRRAHFFQPKQQRSSIALGVEAAPQRSVAVLEFQNVSRSPENAWLSTAIPEMLSTELAAGEKLRLVPGEDVARMKRELHLDSAASLARETAARAGKNLRVDVLVVGSYTVVGQGLNRRMRMDLRLQDARSGEIFAEVAQTGTEDRLFELVSQAGARVREHLGVPGISPAEAEEVRASVPSTPEAARLYAEGLGRMRVFDAAGARDLLVHAVEAEPRFPLSHMALASAWRSLGYDPQARAEAKKALDLSSSLPRADQLLIEGRYHEMRGEMDEAISAYRALFTLFPDSLEDGLLLAASQAWGGKPADALATVEMLRRLPPPLSEDPRIDLSQERAMSIQGASGGLDVVRRAEEKARAQGSPLLVAQAQIRQCSELLYTGQFENAARACEESRRVFADAGSASDLAGAVRFLGDIRQRQGKLTEALELFQEALKIDERARNDRGIAVSSNEMALVYEERGDLREAERLYRKAYQLFLKAGHRKNAGILAGNVGGVLLERGALAEAEGWLQQSMSLAHENGSKDAEAGAHRVLSELALLRGELDRAHQHTDAALSEKNDPLNVFDDQERLSRILAAQGHLDEARKHQLEALALAEKVGARGQAAQSRIGLAFLDFEEGKTVEVEPPIRAALAVFVDEKMRDDEQIGHILLSRCLVAQGKHMEAKAALDEVRAAVAVNQNPARSLMFALAEARVKSAENPRGSLREVQAQLMKTAQTSRRLGYVVLEYEARLELGEAERKASAPTAKRSLSLVEKEARSRGLELISRKAAAANGSKSQ